MDRRAAAADILMQFQREMWESARACYKEAKKELGADASTRDVAAHCLQARNRIAERYCEHSVVEDALVTGTPFLYARGREAITEVALIADENTATITTVCSNKRDRLFYGSQWKYQLRWDGRQWRIATRHVRMVRERRFTKAPIV